MYHKLLNFPLAVVPDVMTLICILLRVAADGQFIELEAVTRLMLAVSKSLRNNISFVVTDLIFYTLLCLIKIPDPSTEFRTVL